MRESIILLSLIYAAWSDFHTGQIPDLCSLGIALCCQSWICAAIGLCLSVGLQKIFVPSRSCGEADPLLLGSLASALPSRQFAALCVGTTILLGIVSPRKSQPLAPYLLGAFIALNLIERSCMAIC